MAEAWWELLGVDAIGFNANVAVYIYTEQWGGVCSIHKTRMKKQCLLLLLLLLHGMIITQWVFHKFFLSLTFQNEQKLRAGCPWRRCSIVPKYEKKENYSSLLSFAAEERGPSPTDLSPSGHCINYGLFFIYILCRSLQYYLVMLSKHCW